MILQHNITTRLTFTVRIPSTQMAPDTFGQLQQQDQRTADTPISWQMEDTLYTNLECRMSSSIATLAL